MLRRLSAVALGAGLVATVMVAPAYAADSVPGAPTGVSVAQSMRRTTVSWTAPADPGTPPFTSYRVYRQVGDATPVAIAEPPAGTTSATETPPPGLTRRYGVSAVNAAGESPTTWSDVYTVPAKEVLFTLPTSPATNGIYAVTPGAAATPVLTDAHDYSTPAASPDGSKIAYSRSNGAGYDVFVADADGSNAVNLTGSYFEGSTDEYDPVFSNNGRQLAFTAENVDQETIRVYSVTLANGSLALRAFDAAHPAWLADSVSLVVSSYASEDAPLVRVAENNTKTTVAGTAGGDEPAVSPDGRWIAFTRYDANGNAGLAVVPSSGSASPAVLADAGGDVEWASPAWAADDKYLAAVRTDWNAETQRLVQVAWNGTALSGGAAILAADDGADAPAWRATGLSLDSAPRYTGTSASVSFSVGEPYTEVTCRLDNGTASPCSSPWTASGLPGGAHTLTLRAWASGGVERVLAHTFVVDTVAPYVTIMTPGTVFSTSAHTTVRYKATDAAGVASYDVRHRSAPYNGAFGPFTVPNGWSGTTATALNHPITPGNTHCFSVRARDTFGNVSPYSVERCTAAPLDDRHLGASAGWLRQNGTAFYYGTVTTTSRYGATLTRTGVQAQRLALVGTRCPTCGVVDVFMGTTRVGRINMAGALLHKAQWLIPAFGSVRSGSVSVRVVSTGKTVQIDGVGVSRVADVRPPF